MRIAKFTKISITDQTSNEINEIYSKGYREVPSKVTRIAKFMKFTKKAKFMIIRQTAYQINEIYSKGGREGPWKVTKITKFTKTCEIYDNSQDH